ncbi:MAG: retropepsin-like aspartic protease [Gammaproteobacteria bacterium]
MRTFSISVIVLFAGILSGWLFRDHFEEQSLENQLVILDAPAKPNESVASFTGEADALYQALNGALITQDSKTVIASYSQLSNMRDDNFQQAAHSRVISQINQVIDRGQFAYAESLVYVLLDEDHRDFTALQLLSMLRSSSGQYIEALDILYEAKGYALNVEEIARIISKIRTIVNQYEEKLRLANKNYQLLELYNYLTRMEPDYSPHFIKLATMQLFNDDKASARSSLALVSQDPLIGSQAREMLRELQIDQTVNEDSVGWVGNVPLKRRGQHFVVNALVNQSYSVDLLIDTGASLTIFTPAMFSQLRTSYSDEGKLTSFNTANGSVQAPVYTIDSLRIGEWQVNDIEVGVLEIAGEPSVDGLLGMNYLRHVQFFIDQKSEVLRFSKQ